MSSRFCEYFKHNVGRAGVDEPTSRKPTELISQLSTVTSMESQVIIRDHNYLVDFWHKITPLQSTCRKTNQLINEVYLALHDSSKYASQT